MKTYGDGKRIIGALTMSGDFSEATCLNTVEKFITNDGEINMELFMSSKLDEDIQNQLLEYYSRSCAEIAALKQELQQLNSQKLDMEDRVNTARMDAMHQKQQAVDLDTELLRLEEQENIIEEIVNTAENIGIVKVSCRRLKEQQKFYTYNRHTLHNRIVTAVEQELTQNSLKPSYSSPDLTALNKNGLVPEIKKTPSAMDLAHGSDFGPALKVNFEAKPCGFNVHFRHDLEKAKIGKKATMSDMSEIPSSTKKRKHIESVSDFETKTIFTTFCRKPENMHTEPGQYSYFEIPNLDPLEKSKRRQNYAKSDTTLVTKRQRKGITESCKDTKVRSTSSRRKNSQNRMEYV